MCFSGNLKRLLLGLIGVLVISIPLLLYANQFPLMFSNEQTDWAGFGSYIGGTLGTFFAFASFEILFYTLNSQQKQAKNSELQRFENTFNSLVELHNQSLNTLNLTIDAHDMYLLCDSQTNLEEIFQIEDGDTAECEVSNQRKEDSVLYFYEKRLENIQDNIKNYVELSQYFRILYQVLKFIALYNVKNVNRDFSNEYLGSTRNISEEHEKMYASLIRGFVPVRLLPLLALNGIPTENSHHNLDKYKSLLERYEFLEHIRLDSLDNYLASILILKSYSKALGENTEIEKKIEDIKLNAPGILELKALHTNYLSKLTKNNPDTSVDSK